MTSVEVEVIVDGTLGGVVGGVCANTGPATSSSITSWRLPVIERIC